MDPEDLLPEKKDNVQTKTTIAVVTYMGFSSTMLITNKAAVLFFPHPSMLLFLQLAVSAAIVWILGKLGKLEVDELNWDKVKQYYGVIVVFVFNLYANVKALQSSNVETVIVFQTLTSLVVAYGDYKLLDSAIPSPPVIASLMVIVGGAIGYVITETFQPGALFWVAMYFLAKTSEMLYTKHIVSTVKMTSWGRSYYNNLLALVPLFFMMIIENNTSGTGGTLEDDSQSNSPSFAAFFFVSLSCAIGLGISIAGFVCRELVSATSFSVIGNMNKIVTVLINVYVWEHHATNLGILSLLVSLLGGYLYSRFKQSPTS